MILVSSLLFDRRIACVAANCRLQGPDTALWRRVEVGDNPVKSITEVFVAVEIDFAACRLKRKPAGGLAGCPSPTNWNYLIGTKPTRTILASG
jgi:hypothetical protein